MEGKHTPLLKRIVFGLSCLFLFFSLFLNQVFADWLSDMVGAPPSAGSVAGNVWIYGGRLGYHPMVKNYHPFMVTPPHLFTTPCGFDAFFGGFSMMRPEALVALAQGVISAAPAYAFNLALGQLCAQCQTTMQHLNSIAMKLNNLGFNSCQVMKQVGDALVEHLNVEADEGHINGLFGALNKRLEAVDDEVEQILNKISGKGKKHTKFAEELADFFINGFTGSDGNEFSVLRQAMVTFGVRTGYYINSFPSDYPYTTVKNVFGSPANLEAFWRAIIGDVGIKKSNQPPQGCSGDFFTLFGDCLTAWITGGDCGGCKGGQVMSANPWDSPIKPPNKDDTGQKEPGAFSSDWSGITIDTGGTQVEWNIVENLFRGKAPGGSFSTKGHYIFGINSIGGSPTLIRLNFGTDTQTLNEYVQQRFTDLKAKIASTIDSNYAFGNGSGSDYLVLQSALSVYYQAYRIATITGNEEWSEKVAERLSEILPAVYVAYTIKYAVDAGITLLEDFATLLTQAPSKELEFVCEGSEGLKAWVSESIGKLRRFRSYVLSYVQDDINNLNKFLIEMEKMNLADTVNKESSKQAKRKGAKK